MGATEVGDRDGHQEFVGIVPVDVDADAVATALERLERQTVADDHEQARATLLAFAAAGNEQREITVDDPLAESPETPADRSVPSPSHQ